MTNGMPLCTPCLEQRYRDQSPVYGKGNQQTFGFGKAGKGAKGKEKGSKEGPLQRDGWLEHLGAPGSRSICEIRNHHDYGPQGFVDNGNNGAASSNGGGNTAETMEVLTQIMLVVSRQEG